jgi:hypothetical protein
MGVCEGGCLCVWVVCWFGGGSGCAWYLGVLKGRRGGDVWRWRCCRALPLDFSCVCGRFKDGFVTDYEEGKLRPIGDAVFPEGCEAIKKGEMRGA